MSLFEQPTKVLIEKLNSGELSSLQLTEESLEAVCRLDGEIEAFTQVDLDRARSQAEDIDKRRKAGQSVGLLAGLPVAVKDNLCTTWGQTTCSSKMLQKYESPFNATVIEKVLQADGVIIGKTNLDEFAMGSTTENSALKQTSHPTDPSRVPGGSSGGSAAAVGAKMVPLALGSDTGGSIRQPASFCGIVGMKPTYGRVSRYGLVAFASSLDQIGPMSTDVYGSARMLQVISGTDPHDSTCLDKDVPDYMAALDQPLAGMKVGVIGNHFKEGLGDDVKAAIDQGIEQVKALGAEIVPIELPYTDHSVAVYYLIAPSEASSNLSRYDGVHYGHRAEEFADLEEMYSKSRAEGFGPEVKRRIMLGTYALSSGYYDAYYKKAMQVRRLIRDDYEKAFEKVDLLIGPTTPTVAFPKNYGSSDPMSLYLADIYTIGANLAGLPALSVPCGTGESDLPVGLQIQGPILGEGKVLALAHQFEQARQ